MVDLIDRPICVGVEGDTHELAEQQGGRFRVRVAKQFIRKQQPPIAAALQGGCVGTSNRPIVRRRSYRG